jgi:hypothetical protein
VPKVSPAFSSLPLVDTRPDRPGALTQPFWPATLPNLEVHIDRSDNAGMSNSSARISMREEVDAEVVGAADPVREVLVGADGGV